MFSVTPLVNGTFASPHTLPAGSAPSDISFADVNADGRPDILVSNQASADVSVLLNGSDESPRFGCSCLPAQSANTLGGVFLSRGHSRTVPSCDAVTSDRPSVRVS